MSTPEHADSYDARPPWRETIALAGIFFAMVAAAMGGQRASRFTGIAVVIAVAGFTVGITIAVVLDRPLF